MKISEKNYYNIFNIIIYILAVVLVNRQISTPILVFFIIYNVLFFKKLSYNKNKLILVFIIATPFLLDLLFLWNNDVFSEGIKTIEKRFSLLLLPLIFLGINKKINLNKLYNYYVIFSVLTLVFLFIRYIYLYTDNLNKYLSGKHLWELGYNFSYSFNIHAPALNMHVSFVTIVAFYLFLLNRNKKWMLKITYFSLFIIAFAFIMYINTRVSLITTIIGVFIVIFYELYKKENLKKALKYGAIFCVTAVISIGTFVSVFPYSIHKFTQGSFGHLDMVGRLDEFENPEKVIYSSLVTRITIWDSAINLSKESFWVGFGSADSKKQLIEYFKKTDQKFLAEYKFQTHNQYLDFLLKYGILGLLVALFYILFFGYIGVKLENPVLIAFCVLFFLSNMTDDFLIRYDGIVFSGLWFSIFANNYYYKNQDFG